MKNTLQRNRDFSATRLSYSRHHLDQSSSRSGLSPSHKPHDSKSLLCNNCFNRQVSSTKLAKKAKQKEDSINQLNTSWTFCDKQNQQKGKETVREQIKKVNEYNLSKIRENQVKKYNEVQQKYQDNEEDQSFVFENIKKIQKNEERRAQLRKDLEIQIAIAKQRRAQAKKQNIQIPFGQLISDQQKNRQKKQRIENEYKKGLLQQIRANKLKKQKEAESRKGLTSSNQLGFVREADEKRRLYEHISNENKEKLHQQFKKKKEMEAIKKDNEHKAKQSEHRMRVEEERRFKEELRRAEEMRKANIEHYLQELKEQIQENKIQRREQFEKIKNSTLEGNALFLESKPNGCSRKIEPCSCCSKTFPKQFLSPFEGGS